MNYRKFYENETLKKLPSSFEVHHLDGDRNNNKIENLLAIPKSLHLKYHSALDKVPDEIFIIKFPLSISEKGNKFNSFLLERLNNFNEINLECAMWKDYKYYLMGQLPNIHNLKY